MLGRIIFIHDIHSQSVIDSLKIELENSQGVKRYDILIELFKENLVLNYDSALDYASMAMKQSLINGDSLSIVKGFNATGWAKMKLGNSLCIPDFEYALGIAERNNYKDQVKFLLNNLAISHSNFANYDKALEYNFKSLQLRQTEGKPLDISVALNNIGIVYSYLLDYENALNYFIQSKELKENNGIQYDLDRAYINIAMTYFKLENYDDASINITKVLELCKAGCGDEVNLEAHYVLSEILIKTNELKKSEEELKFAIRIAKG